MAAQILSVLCWLFGLILTAAGSLVMNVDPREITPGLTHFLTIKCSFSVDGVSEFAGLISMIIAKENQQEQCEDLVSANIFRPDEIKGADQLTGSSSVTGHISVDGHSFLAIQWSMPTSSEAGRYVCQVNGVKNNGHPTEKSQTMNVTSQKPYFDQLTSKVSDLQHQLDGQDTLIQNLQHQLDGQDTLIQNLQHQLDGQDTLIPNLQHQLDGQDTLIQNLQHQLDGQDTLIQNLQHQLDGQDTLIQNLQHQLDGQDTLIQNLQHHLDLQEALIQNQSQTINTLLSLTQTQSDTITTLLNTATDVKEKVKLHSFALPFYVSKEYQGHLYLLSKQSHFSNYEVCEQRCFAYNGYLAEIMDSDQQEFVEGFIDEINVEFELEFVMIGGQKNDDTGTWTYSYSEEPLTYSNWRQGEPHQETGCIVMWLIGAKNWQWMGVSCDHYREESACLCELIIN